MLYNARLLIIILCLAQMERNLQKMYAFQKGCAIMAITKHKQGRLNDTIGGFFDEESSIGNWFRSHNKYEQRDNWLKYSYSTVEMSYDFSFRRKCGRSLIRTGRTIRSIANNVVRVIAKFKKENQSREMTPYEKWQGSANKSNVIVMYKKDKHLPGTTLGDLRVDLQAPLDIMREYIQRNYRDKLNQTCGDSFEFFIELKNGKSKLLDRTKEPGTYSEDFAPFIMNHSTMVGAATIIIVAQDNVKPKIIPEFIDEAFDDGSTVGGDGSTAPGDGKGTDERPGTAGTSGTS